MPNRNYSTTALSCGRAALTEIASLNFYVQFERSFRISNCVANGETVF